MKELFLIAVLFLLNACSSTGSVSSPAFSQNNRAFPQNPKQIALLLPLTSPVSNQARVIQSGFSAAAQAAGNGNTKISVIDTSGKNIADVYQTAIKNGADVVVGPLLKTDVQALENQKLTVPVLALNGLNLGEANQNASLYEFSLSPLDEAQTTADLLKKKGFKNILFLAPKTVWGNNATQTFQNRFQDSTHQVTPIALTNDDLIGQIKTLVAQKNLNQKNAFDVIFLNLPSSAAAQVAPLFNYNNVNTLPIYAAGMAYDNTLNPTALQDLNGVTTCDAPAIFNPNAAEKTNGRLFAFGEDAYSLVQQMNQLNSGGSFAGRTGVLSLRAPRFVHRELSCMQLTNGSFGSAS